MSGSSSSVTMTVGGPRLIACSASAAVQHIVASMPRRFSSMPMLAAASRSGSTITAKPTVEREASTCGTADEWDGAMTGSLEWPMAQGGALAVTNDHISVPPRSAIALETPAEQGLRTLAAAPRCILGAHQVTSYGDRQGRVDLQLMMLVSPAPSGGPQ